MVGTFAAHAVLSNLQTQLSLSCCCCQQHILSAPKERLFHIFAVILSILKPCDWHPYNEACDMSTSGLTLHDPGILPGSADQCILENMFLNLPLK